MYRNLAEYFLVNAFRKTISIDFLVVKLVLVSNNINKSVLIQIDFINSFKI